MEIGRHLDQGALARGSKNYTGAHQNLEGWIPIDPSKGIYGAVLGNRSSKPGYGFSTVEERDSDPNIRRV